MYATDGQNPALFVLCVSSSVKFGLLAVHHSRKLPACLEGVLDSQPPLSFARD